ncbi:MULTISPECIES: recombinase family protein [unclassified Frankia]|uniref:recombinase family protein n=1 Tax=unclassified Frankia TaxID=2632575 RepID=UPI0027DC05E5|nr:MULTISPECIES: recombinase family protein [unclassified Frankia]
MSRKLRTIGYRRISDDREGLEAGVTRQDEDIRELAARRDDIRLIDVLTDNDLSATRDYRPQFEHILEMAAAGEIDAVVAWTSNRFFRSSKDRFRVLDLFEAKGIRIIPVRGSEADPTTADGYLMVDLMGAIDRAESKRTAERVSRSAKQRAEQGRNHGGRRAYGYGPVIAIDHNGKAVRDFHALVPDEADVIRGIAADVLEGKPLGAIARALNAAGVGTVTKKHAVRCPNNVKGRKSYTDCGCPFHLWGAVTLKEMMVNPRLIGMRGYKTKATRRDTGTIAVMGPARWPAILDVDTWEQIRAILTDAVRRTSTGTEVRRLLAGFLYCAACGYKMTNNGRAPRMYCHRRKGTCPAPVRIGEPYLIKVVGRAVRNRLDGLELRPAETADPGSGELATLELRKKALADRWASGEIEEDDYETRLRAITSKIREAQTRVRTSTRRRAALPVNGAAGWDDLGDDLAAKRVILTHLIDGVIIGGDGTVDGDTVRRMRIVWRDLNDPR